MQTYTNTKSAHSFSCLILIMFSYLPVVQFLLIYCVMSCNYPDLFTHLFQSQSGGQGLQISMSLIYITSDTFYETKCLYVSLLSKTNK